MIGLIRALRVKSNCFHHSRGDNYLGISWIDGWIIDFGKRKMFKCRACHKKWIV